MKYKIDILGTEWIISKPTHGKNDYYLDLLEKSIYYPKLENDIDVLSKEHSKLREAILESILMINGKPSGCVVEFLAEYYDDIHIAMRDMELVEC